MNKNIIFLVLLFTVCSVFGFADEVQGIALSSNSNIQVQDAQVSSYNDPSKYTLFGENADYQNKSTKNKLMSKRTSLGLSFGILNLIEDNESSSSNILSRQDSVKNYIGLNATYTTNSLNFNLGVGTTYNLNYLPVSLSVGYNVFVPDAFRGIKRSYYNGSRFERNNQQSVSSIASETEDFIFLLIGFSCLNTIPTKSNYNLTTAILLDLGISVFVPEMQYLSLNFKLSPGWSHVYAESIEKNDFFALNFEIGMNVLID